jgi:hypothetical protein
MFVKWRCLYIAIFFDVCEIILLLYVYFLGAPGGWRERSQTFRCFLFLFVTVLRKCLQYLVRWRLEHFLM